MRALRAQWTLLVDSNEQAHSAAQQPRAVDRRDEMQRLSTLRTEVRKLNVGDYALVCIPPTSSSSSSSSSSAAEPRCEDGPLPEERCVALFERKAYADHVASMRDATCRYHDQAQRLVASGCPHPYWALIDAPAGSVWSAQDVAGVEKSALHIATTYKPVQVLRLRNGDAAFGAAILAVCHYLDRDLFGEGSAPDLPLHTVVQERGARPRLDTQPVVWLEQLTLPHRMSRTSARAVAARYPDVMSLLALWRRRRDEFLARGDPVPEAQPRRGRRKKNKKQQDDGDDEDDEPNAGRKRTRRPEPTLDDYLDASLADIPLPDERRLGPACSAMLRRVFLPDSAQLRYVRSPE